MTIDSQQQFSWKKATLLILGIGLLTAGLFIFIQSQQITFSSDTTSKFGSGSTPTPEYLSSLTATIPRNTLSAGSGSSFEVIESSPHTPNTKTAKIRIPSIGVDAKIQSVGLSWKGNGEMGVPTNFTDVAWYKGGPLPGEPGSAVIAGHLDGEEVSRAVFYNINKLKVGDTVEVVDSDGKTLKFRVFNVKVYDHKANTEEVFISSESTRRLNLITCGGSWDKENKLYDKRIVVFTELIST